MTIQAQETTMEDSDEAAVSELIEDIEAEMRLHLMRVQEFLDGAAEAKAVTDADSRERLLQLSQRLRGCIEEIAALGA